MLIVGCRNGDDDNSETVAPVEASAALQPTFTPMSAIQPTAQPHLHPHDHTDTDPIANPVGDAFAG